MSVKISELPNITAASLLTVSSAVFPLVANLSSNNTTFQTTIANVKTFMETGNLNVIQVIFNVFVNIFLIQIIQTTFVTDLININNFLTNSTFTIYFCMDHNIS